jgi:hypothetical protein
MEELMVALLGPMDERVVIARAPELPVADLFTSDNLIAVLLTLVLAFAASGVLALTYLDCRSSLSLSLSPSWPRAPQSSSPLQHRIGGEHD